VGISGNTAIIGVPGDDARGTVAGAAFLFDVDTGKQRWKLTASDAAPEDQFGHDVAISGNIAIVGSVFSQARTGAAYLFDVTTGRELAKLTASDAAPANWFGDTVAIDGNLAVVGARWNDGAFPATGAAYAFDVSTGKQLARLTAFDASERDWLGGSVAVSGNRVLAGAWGDDDAGSRSGSAYLFTLVPEPSSGVLLILGLAFVRRWRP
jgi:outer membrane protein assembly factor BamB